MIKVSLYGAEFFARHGFYKEEQILGNYFVVNVEACFEPKSVNINDDLNNTLNYERLYEIAQSAMKIPKQLLETVAQGIADDIILQFPYINTLEVEVKKLNPPLKGKVAASGITVYITNN
ncbi:dihydroneopterin aldolase [Mucilaginibacter galii]|uniref:7,8-dihydroneopterin aldolase n=1 Tax=Mucilaginibacter galii TaxID=2005073 RepID=A0A917J9B0_9SPHI|nr:dihydroneopterin aldolase [Mucilaginibacter galii]GGI51383.1 7,8-dihydroneopterin aldolase [Mucilaginibacter galii]